MAQAGRQPFTIGRVLGRAFPIWGKNIVQFAILSAIIHSPLILHAALAAPETGDQEASLFLIVQNIGRLLLGLMATAAVIHGVFQQLRGKQVGIGACLRVCIARFLPVLGVGILVGLLFVVCFVPIGFVVGVGAPPVAALIVGIGALVLASVFYCTFWMAIPVAVVEKPGVVASLGRSARLTRGSRLRIFVILLVVLVTQFVVALLAQKAIGDEPMARVWTGLLFAIVFGALSAVANAVAYHDLRVAKEGVGIEELVAVFA